MAHDQHEIRVALIGATGAGKSASGNTLLGRIKFEESSGATRGTHFSETDERENIIGFPNMKLAVTDTPGLGCTDQNPEQACAHIVQFIGQLSPGPHVIVIVVSAGRVSSEIQETVKSFSSMFGEGSTAHMMFLFTKVDQLNTRFNPTPTTIEKWLENLTKENKEFYDIFLKCGRRYCGINNRIPFDSDDHRQQNTRIMNMFVQIKRQNGGEYYTNDDFQMIEERVMRLLDERTADRNRYTSRNDIVSLISRPVQLVHPVQLILDDAMVAGFTRTDWLIYRDRREPYLTELGRRIAQPTD